MGLFETGWIFGAVEVGGHNQAGFGAAFPLTVKTSGLPVFFMSFIRPDEFRLNVVIEWISWVTSIMASFFCSIILASFFMLRQRKR